MSDYRCYTCDSRYCGAVCRSKDPSYAYVPSKGWVHVERAVEYQRQGFPVDWPQSPAWDVIKGLGRGGWSPVREAGHG